MCYVDTKTLLKVKVREAPLKELGSYGRYAMSTMGSKDDYLYFLPRILQLIATDDWDYGPDVLTIARSIHATEPYTWSANHRRALEEYFSAAVSILLAPGRHREISEWLNAIARTGLDVRPYLHAIEQSTDAVLQYFTDNAGDLPHRRLTTSPWANSGDLPNAGHEAIVAWFYSPRIRKIVFDAYGYVLPMQE